MYIMLIQSSLPMQLSTAAVTGAQYDFQLIRYVFLLFKLINLLPRLLQRLGVVQMLYIYTIPSILHNIYIYIMVYLYNTYIRLYYNIQTAADTIQRRSSIKYIRVMRTCIM